MSYDVYIIDYTGNVACVPHHHLRGGTYEVGGSDRAELNITFNYSKHFRRVLDEAEGLKWLDGKPVKDTIECLDAAIEALQQGRDEDYWAATEGNARAALFDLRCLAAATNFSGTWEVSC